MDPISGINQQNQSEQNNTNSSGQPTQQPTPPMPTPETNPPVPQNPQPSPATESMPKAPTPQQQTVPDMMELDDNRAALANNRIVGGVEPSQSLPKNSASAIYNEVTKPKSKMPIFALLAVGLLALIGGGLYWYFMYMPGLQNEEPNIPIDEAPPAIEQPVVNQEPPMETTTSATNEFEMDTQIQRLEQVDDASGIRSVEQDLNQTDVDSFDSELQDSGF